MVLKNMHFSDIIENVLTWCFQRKGTRCTEVQMHKWQLIVLAHQFQNHCPKFTPYHFLEAKQKLCDNSFNPKAP